MYAVLLTGMTSKMQALPSPAFTSLAFIGSTPLTILSTTRSRATHQTLTKRIHPARQYNARQSRPRNARISPTTSALPALSTPVTQALTAATAASTPFAIWTVLLAAATLGITSQKYRWGRTLTPPLVSTISTLLLSNLGLLPTQHAIYTTVMKTFIPLAIPLILFGADLRRVFKQTGRLLPVFITGAFATCVGTLVAWCTVPIKRSAGPQAWKIAAALTARHIGGAVNYVAVVDATAAPADLVTAALTADNVVVAVYFILLLVLARQVNQPAADRDRPPGLRDPSPLQQSSASDSPSDSEESSGQFSLPEAAIAISISAAMCSVAAFVTGLLPINPGIIPIVTAIAVTVATTASQKLQRYRHAASAIGIFFMQVFFAVSGAGGSFKAVITKAPLLFAFSIVQLMIHLLVLLFFSRLARFHRAEVLIASNANVGGPSTAAAMATSKGWDRLVAPALLVGVFGYSVATLLSLALGYGVLRLL